MAAGGEFAAIEDRIGTLLGRLAESGGEAQAAGEELIARTVELHTPALTRLLDALRGSGGDELVDRLVADPVVGELLALHHLPPPPEPSVVHLPLPRRREAAPVPAAPDPDHGPTGDCELCGGALEPDHRHGVDVDERRLVCTCRACSLVLSANVTGRGRFRALPDRVLAVPDFATGGRWDALGIPVSTAFFFIDSNVGGVVAFYPSPAGATESTLAEGVWEALAEGCDAARDLQPDTEAILVRDGPDGMEGYLVPIDRCYSLVGLLRTRWRGFDGGQDAHDALAGYFVQLQAQASPVRVGAGA
jgi:hypothetical protein